MQRLTRDEGRTLAREITNYLKREYPDDVRDRSEPPLASRRVSDPEEAKPIQKLITENRSNELSHDLNSLSIAFNDEIADFINKSGDEKILKADGLSRIPGRLLNEKFGKVDLEYYGLRMEVSEFAKWYKVLERLCNNTLLCHKTDGAVNHGDSRLCRFLDGSYRRTQQYIK